MAGASHQQRLSVCRPLEREPGRKAYKSENPVRPTAPSLKIEGARHDGASHARTASTSTARAEGKAHNCSPTRAQTPIRGPTVDDGAYGTARASRQQPHQGRLGSLESLEQKPAYSARGGLPSTSTGCATAAIGSISCRRGASSSNSSKRSKRNERRAFRRHAQAGSGWHDYKQRKPTRQQNPRSRLGPDGTPFLAPGDNPVAG